MIPEEDTRTPVISPGLQLLKSRKTMVALVTAIVSVLILVVPDLEKVQGELITILTILASVLIASIAHEDAASKGSPTTVATGSGDVTVTTPPAPPNTPEPPTG